MIFPEVDQFSIMDVRVSFTIFMFIIFQVNGATIEYRFPKNRTGCLYNVTFWKKDFISLKIVNFIWVFKDLLWTRNYTWKKVHHFFAYHFSSIDCYFSDQKLKLVTFSCANCWSDFSCYTCKGPKYLFQKIRILKIAVFNKNGGIGGNGINKYY